MCAGEKGYEGGGLRREAWWHQEATEKQLRETFKGVSQEANRKRLQVEIFMQWDTEVVMKRGKP